MSDWRNDGMAEDGSAENDFDPTLKASHLEAGDGVVLTFDGDGEEIDTQYGVAVKFEAALEDAADADLPDQFTEGEGVEVLTSSSRLLSALAEAADNLDGATLKVVRTAVGMDTDYSVDTL